MNEIKDCENRIKPAIEYLAGESKCMLTILMDKNGVLSVNGFDDEENDFSIASLLFAAMDKNKYVANAVSRAFFSYAKHKGKLIEIGHGTSNTELN